MEQDGEITSAITPGLVVDVYSSDIKGHLSMTNLIGRRFLLDMKAVRRRHTRLNLTFLEASA